MRLPTHIALGAVAAAAAYPKFGAPWALVFWVSSFLIDMDHYIEYLYFNGMKDFSVKKMFRYFEEIHNRHRRPEFMNLSVFHTVEFLVPLCLVTWWSGSALAVAVAAGFVFHVFLDTMNLVYHSAFTIRAHSLIEYFIRRRLLMARGMSPSTIPYESLAAILDENEKRESTDNKARLLGNAR